MVPRFTAGVITLILSLTGLATPSAAGARSSPKKMGMSVQLAEGILTGNPSEFREVRGGGEFVMTDSSVITNLEVWGTRSKATFGSSTNLTKVEVQSFYGADATHPSLLNEQLAFDDLVCGNFGSQGVQNWCRSRILSMLDTNATASRIAISVLDEGQYRLPYRFTITTQKSGLGLVDIQVTAA